MINSFLHNISLFKTASPPTPRREPVADQDAVIPFPKSNATISCMDQNKSLIHLHNRLYISLFDAPRSSQIALHELSSNFLIIPFDKNYRERLMSSDLLDNDGLSLAEIYDFDLMMQAVTRQNPGSKLVVCAGAFPTIRARTAILLGSHMILSLGLSYDFVSLAFSPLRELLKYPILDDNALMDDGVWNEELTASNCWGALSSAVATGMVDFGHPFASGNSQASLCVEELLHYSECVPPFPTHSFVESTCRLAHDPLAARSTAACASSSRAGSSSPRRPGTSRRAASGSTAAAGGASGRASTRACCGTWVPRCSSASTARGKARPGPTRPGPAGPASGPTRGV